MTRYYPVIATLSAVLALLLIWSTGVQSALFAPHAGDARGVPHLRLAEARQELGTVAADKPARAKFQVANDGTRRLVIRRETGHCCGRGGPEEITIVPPGDSATLVVEVETTGIRGGLQQEIVYATNDPKMPQFRLTVVASVESGVQDQR